MTGRGQCSLVTAIVCTNSGLVHSGCHARWWRKCRHCVYEQRLGAFRMSCQVVEEVSPLCVRTAAWCVQDVMPGGGGSVAIVCTNSGLVHSGCHARWWRKCRHCVYEQQLGAFRMSCQVVEEVSPLCVRTAAWCVQDVMPGGGGSVAIVCTNSGLVHSGCHARWWRKCRHCVYEQRLGAFRMSCQVVEEVSPLCVRTAAWCIQDVMPGGGGSVAIVCTNSGLVHSGCHARWWRKCRHCVYEQRLGAFRMSCQVVEEVSPLCVRTAAWCIQDVMPGGGGSVAIVFTNSGLVRSGCHARWWRKCRHCVYEQRLGAFRMSCQVVEEVSPLCVRTAAWCVQDVMPGGGGSVAIVCTNSGLVHSGCHARWWRKCRHCVYEQRLGAFRMSCQVVEEVSPLCVRTAAWCIQDVMPGGGGSVAIVCTNSGLVHSGCHARWWRKCRHCVYEQRLGAFRMSCQVVEEVSPLCVRTAAWCIQDVMPGGGGSVAIVCTNSGLVHSGCHARWWRKCRHCVYEQRLGAFRMSCQVVEEVSPLCVRTAAWCIQDVMPGGGGSVAIVCTNSGLVHSGCHARWWRKCRHCVYEQRLGAFRMSCQVVEEVSPLCVRTAAWCIQDVMPGGGGSVAIVCTNSGLVRSIVNGNMTVQHSVSDCRTIFPTAGMWCHQHTARIVQNFLEAIDVVLLWQACLPDMSPTEHL